MDYRRTYWLLFLGAGLLFGLLQYLDYAATGAFGVWTALTVLVAALVVVASGYAVAFPDRAGGPEESNARFAFALGMFLLMLVLLADRLLG